MKVELSVYLFSWLCYVNITAIYRPSEQKEIVGTFRKCAESTTSVILQTDGSLFQPQEFYEVHFLVFPESLMKTAGSLDSTFFPRDLDTLLDQSLRA